MGWQVVFRGSQARACKRILPEAQAGHLRGAGICHPVWKLSLTSYLRDGILARRSGFALSCRVMDWIMDSYTLYCASTACSCLSETPLMPV